MSGTLRSLTDRFLATLILHPLRRARQPEEMWVFGLLLPATSSRGRCLLARRLDVRVSVLYREGRSGSDGCYRFPDVGVPENRAAAAESFTRRRGVLSFAATC